MLGREDNPFMSMARSDHAVLTTSDNPKFDYRTDAEACELSLVQGYRLTDNSLLEALGWFDPPLFPDDMIQLVVAELNPAPRRRGRRPAAAFSPKDIAAYLESLEREDLPPTFQKNLAERLRDGRRYTEFMRALPVQKKLWRRQRDNLMTYLYRLIFDRLKTGPEWIFVEPIGHIKVCIGDKTPSDKAIEMVRMILADKVMVDLPGDRRMKNIISAN